MIVMMLMARIDIMENSPSPPLRVLDGRNDCGRARIGMGFHALQ